MNLKIYMKKLVGEHHRKKIIHKKKIKIILQILFRLIVNLMIWIRNQFKKKVVTHQDPKNKIKIILYKILI